jgi:hypothetical protein
VRGSIRSFIICFASIAKRNWFASNEAGSQAGRGMCVILGGPQGTAATSLAGGLEAAFAQQGEGLLQVRGLLSL